MSNLKACPFCGKVPEIKESSGSYGYYPGTVYIKCCNNINIAAPVEEYDWDKRKYLNTKDKAISNIIERWNLRSN